MAERAGGRSAADIAAALASRRMVPTDRSARENSSQSAVGSPPSMSQAPTTAQKASPGRTFMGMIQAPLASLAATIFGSSSPAAAPTSPATPGSSLLSLKVPPSSRKAPLVPVSSGNIEAVVAEQVKAALSDRCASLLCQDGRCSIPLIGVDDVLTRVNAHIRSAVGDGAGGSLLLLGPRGAGKRSIIADCLARAQQDVDFDVLSLEASTLSDDAAAMRELSRLIECAGLRPLFNAFKTPRGQASTKPGSRSTAAVPVPSSTAWMRPSDAGDVPLKKAPETGKYLHLLARARLGFLPPSAASDDAATDERPAARKMRLAREMGGDMTRLADSQAAAMGEALQHAWRAVMHGVPLPSGVGQGEAEEQLELTQPVTADADGTVIVLEASPIKSSAAAVTGIDVPSRKRPRSGEGDAETKKRSKARSAAWIDTNKQIYDHHLHSVTRSLCPAGGGGRATVIVIHDIDRLAHASRQTFLYHVLDMACSPTSRVSIIATSARVDVEALLEKRLRSRLAAKTVCVNPSPALCLAVMEEVLKYPSPPRHRVATSGGGDLSVEVAAYAHAMRTNAAVCDGSLFPLPSAAAAEVPRARGGADGSHVALEAAWTAAVRDVLQSPAAEAYWRACGYVCTARAGILAARDMVRSLDASHPLPSWTPLLQHACVREAGIAYPLQRILLVPPPGLPHIAMLAARTVSELLLLGAMAHLELRAAESSRDGDMHTLLTLTRQEYNFTIIFHELRATLLGARATARRAAIVAAMQVHGASAAVPQEGVLSRHVAVEEVALVAFERLVECGLVRLLPRRVVAAAASGDATADADDASAALVSNTLQLSHAAVLRDTTPQLRDSKAREDLRHTPCCLLLEPLALLDAVRQGHIHVDTAVLEWLLHGGKEAPGL